MTQQKPDIFTVVLTGGIASGKSTVSGLFEALGVPVVDTDRISRELVEAGKPALEAIVDAFGRECLDGEGGLDRRRMRSVIFADPEARKRLESILHPLIGGEVLRRITALDATYCIVVIPLYTESSAYGWIDRVLVVDADADTQIARVMARDGASRELARAILASQASRSERLALADDVIRNEGSMDQLAAQVRELHRQYSALAQPAG
jgi:dephospho-CoA kinase